MSRGRPRKQTDWVAHEETYGVRASIAINTIVSLPLVWPPAAFASTFFFQSPQPEYTVTRVKGRINVHLDAFENRVFTDAATLRMRIAVHTTEPTDGDDAVVGAHAPEYQLQSARTADEDFLWHENIQFLHTAAFWADFEGFVGPVTESIHVDVRTKRRLRRNDGLFLILQWGDGLENTSWFNALVQMDLRTLIAF